MPLYLWLQAPATTDIALHTRMTGVTTCGSAKASPSSGMSPRVRIAPEEGSLTGSPISPISPIDLTHALESMAVRFRFYSIGKAWVLVEGSEDADKNALAAAQDKRRSLDEMPGNLLVAQSRRSLWTCHLAHASDGHD
jgi:hypothetical protein